MNKITICNHDKYYYDETASSHQCSKCNKKIYIFTGAYGDYLSNKGYQFKYIDEIAYFIRMAFSQNDFDITTRTETDTLFLADEMLAIRHERPTCLNSAEWHLLEDKLRLMLARVGYTIVII